MKGLLVRRRRIGAWYRLAIVVIKPLLLLFTRRSWRGAENLPVQGGFVAVTNHLSELDPFTFAHFMYDNGALPRFLVKESLFRARFTGRVVRGAQQIPVARESTGAALSYDAAVDAVRRGECVAVYPEGTITRDPGLWPMRGKTGAARIALATGCPVIPVVQWGVHDILAPYARRPKLLPRRMIQVWAGPPIDLSRFAGQEPAGQDLAAATAQIMDTLTSMLEQLRGERAPGAVWDPREHGQPVTGNPHRHASRAS